MISQAIQKLAKRIFLIIAFVMLAGFPLTLWASSIPGFNGEIPLEAMNPVNYLTIAVMVVFSLVLVAMLLFLILPALSELVQAIWSSIQGARQDREAELFP